MICANCGAGRHLFPANPIQQPVYLFEISVTLPYLCFETRIQLSPEIRKFSEYQLL